MTLQIVNSTTAGATQDLSSRVFMASERLGLPPFSITQNAEEGSVGMSTLVVDDSAGNLTLKGHRRIYFVETSAPSGQQVIGNTYIGTKTIERGDWVVGPLARTFSVQLADANTLIGRRLMVGGDANRRAETDVQRVQWLLTTTAANEFNGPSTSISTDELVSMDAVDYRGQSITAILSDCSQASGKNWWVVYFESVGRFGLWYDFDYSAVYSSTISLSNLETDVDDSTVFAYFPTATLTQDPSRVYSGTLIDFQPANTETTSWIYEQQTSTGNEFVFRDVAYPSINVKTETKARARAQRYNADSDEEDDVVKLSFVVPAASVNALMHGHRIQVKGSHWGPGATGTKDYTAYSWMRCLQRTVTQLSSTHYRLDVDLSPVTAVPVTAAYAELWAGSYGPAGSGPVYFINDGDDPPSGTAGTPLTGSLSYIEVGTGHTPQYHTSAHRGGINVLGDGTLTMHYTADFITVGWSTRAYVASIRLNGVVLASDSVTIGEGIGEWDVLAQDVEVEAGDLIEVYEASTAGTVFKTPAAVGGGTFTVTGFLE